LNITHKAFCGGEGIIGNHGGKYNYVTAHPAPTGSFCIAKSYKKMKQFSNGLFQVPTIVGPVKLCFDLHLSLLLPGKKHDH
jgi:hypothetical protein